MTTTGVEEVIEEAQDDTFFPEAGTETETSEGTKPEQPASVSTSTRDDQEAPPSPSVVLDPFAQKTITLTLKFLPDDAKKAGGREVMVGVFIEGEVALLDSVREEQLGALPTALTDKLEQLRARLLVKSGGGSGKQPKAAGTAAKKDDSVTISPIQKAAATTATAKVVGTTTASGQKSAKPGAAAAQPSLFDL